MAVERNPFEGSKQAVELDELEEKVEAVTAPDGIEIEIEGEEEIEVIPMESEHYANLVSECDEEKLKEIASEVIEGFNTDKEFLEALDKTGIKILNRDEVLKGKPAVITGDATTDAFEIGGANYMTAIDKRGKITQIVNDEHDLLSRKIPKTNIEVGKLPGADRFMNVSEPIVYDLINPAKKATNIQKDAKAALKAQKKSAELSAIEEYEKIPGVKVREFNEKTKKYKYLPKPVGFKSHEQWARAQAVAKAQPTRKDYSRLAFETGFVSGRVARPLTRDEENKKGGGSVIERNPYNYPPRSI